MNEAANNCQNTQQVYVFWFLAISVMGFKNILIGMLILLKAGRIRDNPVTFDKKHKTQMKN